MGKFSGKPKLEYIGNELSRLTADFIYTPDKKWNFKPVSIPKGFITDLVSVPPIARCLVHKYGDEMMGALPHDYIYHTQLRSRKEADKIILLAMEDANKLKGYKIGWFKRMTIYRAVRSFGWIPWNKRAKEIKLIRKQLENDGVEDNERRSS